MNTRELNNNNNEIKFKVTTVQNCKMSNTFVFERSLLCSIRLHLFYQKYSKTVIL